MAVTLFACLLFLGQSAGCFDGVECGQGLAGACVHGGGGGVIALGVVISRSLRLRSAAA